jgi:hypothetical protein
VDACSARCRLSLWSSREATLKAFLGRLCSAVRTERHLQLRYHSVIRVWMSVESDIGSETEYHDKNSVGFLSRSIKYRVSACTAQSLCSRLIWSEKTAMSLRTLVKIRTQV